MQFCQGRPQGVGNVLARLGREALLRLLIGERESWQARHEDIIPAKDISSLVQQVGSGDWNPGVFMQVLHEPALTRKLNCVKGRATQDKASLGTCEKNMLPHVAKPDRFGREEAAKLKAIQCGLKLLLRQSA